MGIFDRFHKKNTNTSSQKEKDISRSKELEAVKKQTDANVSSVPLKKAEGGNELSSRFLRGPHISEKAAKQTEKDTYVFDVTLNAEKISVKKAVESLYKVNVVKVRMIRHAGKPVYRGRIAGARPSWKKALVTLKPGQKIDLYAGV